MIYIENEVEVNFEKLENNKSDIKIELLDTLMCSANFFKLTNNSSYHILQGGCLVFFMQKTFETLIYKDFKIKIV